MLIKNFLLSATLFFSFTQYLYGSQNIPNPSESKTSVERINEKIDRTLYPTADLVTEAQQAQLKTFYSDRNARGTWATTYMHILMYQLLLEKGMLDDPQKTVTIITDTLNDGATSAIEHSTKKHVNTKSKTGQAVQELHDVSGYKTEISIQDLINYFGMADQTIAVNEDKQFAKWIYEILQGENVSKIFKKPVLQFTFLDVIGYIFTKTVKYQTERENDHYSTSIVCTLGVNEGTKGTPRPIKLKAIFHSKEPLEKAEKVYFKSIYPITNANYDCDKDYTSMPLAHIDWLLKTQALQNSLLTWNIDSKKLNKLQDLIRNSAEERIKLIVEEIGHRTGYALKNYVTYFSSLYRRKDEITGEMRSLKDQIIDLLLKDGKRKEATTIIKDMVKYTTDLPMILMLTIFNSREEDILEAIKDTSDFHKDPIVITLPVGRGIAGEMSITDRIGLWLISLKKLPLGTEERADEVTKIQNEVMDEINKINKADLKKIPEGLRLSNFDIEELGKDFINAGYSTAKVFCYSIYCINEAIVDFFNKNPQLSEEPQKIKKAHKGKKSPKSEKSLPNAKSLYDSVQNTLLYIFNTIDSIPGDESYQIIASFPYQFTKQFIWMYYMRSTITEKDQINNEIKRLRDTAAENPLALSLTDVMQAILQKDTTKLQDSIKVAREKIERIKKTCLNYSFKAKTRKAAH